MAFLPNILSVLSLISFLLPFLLSSPVNAIAPLNDLASRHEPTDHLGLARRRRRRRDINKRCPAPSPKAASTGSVNVESSGSSGSVNVEELRGGRGIIGLGWRDGKNPSSFISDKVNMLYTWTPYCPPASDRHGVPCCPMLWGEKSVSEFDDLVKEGYSTCVMGMNEPELPYPQSDISPGKAASLWKDKIAPLRKKGYNRFFLPALATDDGAEGWMREFLKECDGCSSYAHELPLHVYDVDPNKAIKTIKSFHEAFPEFTIAITELGCQAFYGKKRNCDSGDVKNFIKGVMEWAKNTPWISMVAYYGMFTEGDSPGGHDGVNAMIGGGGSPNELFKYWVDI